MLLWLTSWLSVSDEWLEAHFTIFLLHFKRRPVSVKRQCDPGSHALDTIIGAAAKTTALNWIFAAVLLRKLDRSQLLTPFLCIEVKRCLSLRARPHACHEPVD